MRRFRINILFLFLSCAIPGYCDAYSVLTHQAIIDASWESAILPLLKQKFPEADSIQFKEAYAYAYGGAIMPDMGYFPFNNKFFTNLVHYVRTGDFTNCMLDEAKDVLEYAFALGLVAHYHADNYGHPIGVNRCVPILFPETGMGCGDTVTYVQDPMAHIRTEFSFDVLQVTKGNYLPDAYRSFIGFKVADSLLIRSFYKTYGLDIHCLYPDLSRAINTFRWAVKEVFPLLTKAAWKANKDEILASSPQMTRSRFVYRMRRKNYFGEYGRERDGSLIARTVICIIRILPKIGPLKKLKVRVPGPDATRLFEQSFDAVVSSYIGSLKQLRSQPTFFTNRDFDTGNETEPGEYIMSDCTYTYLLLLLKNNDFLNMDPVLKANIQSYFEKPHLLIQYKKSDKRMRELDSAVEHLKRL